MTSPLCLPVLCLALLSLGHVTSFSIRHRAERSTDLADALAILQRQRRRVGDDFLQAPNRLLEDEPLTLQDVSDWFSGATGSKAPFENEDMESDWLPDLGGYKDFEPSDMGYDLRPGVYPTAPVKASPREIEAIFEADGDDESPRVKKAGPALSKKTKEEMVNVKGDRNVLHKSSRSNAIVKPASQKHGSPNEVLNSLTKEEVKVLMKAVGKLQEQLGNARDLDNDDDNEGLYDDDKLDHAESGTDEAIVVSEPVSQEELKSVFEESDGPINKETRILLEKGPDDKEPTLVEEQVITEKLPEISEDEEEEEVENELTKALTNELANELEEERESEEEAAAEEAVADVAAAAVAAANLENQSGEDVEDVSILDEEKDENIPLDLEAQRLATKYWLLNGDKFFEPPNKALKRTAKRASGILENNKDSSSAQKPFEKLGQLGKGNNHAQINLSWLSPQLQAFVLKIISLQDEVDRLRLEARLEDLENDALTDALNEATLAQVEGTVSDIEWSSLQQAINLEAALQDIKHSKPASSMSINEGESDDGFDDDVVDDSNDNIIDNTPKRGEPWRRKRLPSAVSKDDDLIYTAPDSDFSLAPSIDSDDAIKNRAIEKLLEQSYFLKGKPGAQDEDSEDIASLFMSDPERCPAVQRYSSNCALADVYSVPVDFEARALCNLHEMCYACGKSLGVEQGQCDLVYRTAASSLCKGKDECEAEAEVFLRAMKLKTRYITHAQPTCRSRCTAKFLGMF